MFTTTCRSLRLLLGDKGDSLDADLADAERLSKNPLVNFATAKDADQQAAFSTAEKGQTSKSTENAKERRVYNLDFIYAADEEYSFEERRARMPRYQVNTRQTPTSSNRLTSLVSHSLYWNKCFRRKSPLSPFLTS